MAVLMILDIACAALIKIPPVERQTSVWAGVLNILCQPRVAVFLVWCFGCGLLTSVIWQWLLWYLSDLATKESTSSCGDSQSWVTTLLGINMAVQCFVGEVPMFFLSGWVLRNLGHAHTMSLVLIAFSLRFFLYSLLSDPWFSLPIELLNGVTFGLCYAAMTGYAHTIAPEGMEATVQGVVGAVYEVILSVCFISNLQLCCHLMNHQYPKLMFICRVRVWPQALWLAEPSTRTMVVFSYSGLKGLQINHSNI